MTRAKSILQKFKTPLEELPDFKNEQDEKTFLQLQKYNLIYVTPEGTFKITSKGKEALKYDVEKFLQIERFEEKLIKQSLRKNRELNWIFYGFIPLIIITTIVLILLEI